MRTATLVLLVCSALTIVRPHAQSAPALAAAPTGRADVGPWAAAIVRRAAQMIPTPDKWDRASTGACRSCGKCGARCTREQGSGVRHVFRHSPGKDS